jgi:hypothetical protein
MLKIAMRVVTLVMVVLMVFAGAALAGVNQGASVSVDFDPATGDQELLKLSSIGPSQNVVMEVHAKNVANLVGFGIWVEVDTAAIVNVSGTAKGPGYLLSQKNPTDVPVLSTLKSYTAPSYRGQPVTVWRWEVGGAALPPDATKAVTGTGLLAKLTLRTAPKFFANETTVLKVTQVVFRGHRDLPEADKSDTLLSALKMRLNPPGPKLEFKPLLAQYQRVPKVEAEFTTDIARAQKNDKSKGDMFPQVIYTDEGDPVPNQEIKWSLKNMGQDKVWVTSGRKVVPKPPVLVEPGKTVELTATTGPGGISLITVDAFTELSYSETTLETTVSTNTRVGVLTATHPWVWRSPGEKMLRLAGALDVETSDVVLVWTAVSQPETNKGWDVYRSVDRAQYTKIGEVADTGSAGDTLSFQFVDTDVPSELPRGRIWYYLNQIPVEGDPTRSKDVEIIVTITGVEEEAGTPDAFALSQNYPNPFNPETTISYALPEASRISLVIYDGAGQHVRTLADHHLEAGRYEVVWDGRNAAGQEVGSGLYFYELRAGKFRGVRKMLLVR